MRLVKVLVVGGAGYIGSHVVKALLKENHEVVIYDNLSSGQRINIMSGATFIEGDILDYPSLSQVMGHDIEAVVHLAAKKAVGESMENPAKYALNNITGSLNIMNAMLENGVKNLVFSSSAAVYGMPQYLPIDEEHPLNPMNFYGFTKFDIEKYMAWYAQLKDFHYMALRYFNAVGYDAQGDVMGREVGSQNLLPIIMDVAMGRRDSLSVFGEDYDTPDGTCIRDYVHVSDLAKAHVLAIEHLVRGGESACLNLGTGKGTSVKEMIASVEKVTGKKLNVKYVERRAGDPGILTASSLKASKMLGWKADYTDVEDIVRTTLVLEN